MVIGPHIHDPSGHRYGKGNLDFASALKAGLKAGVKNKQRQIEKNQKETKHAEDKPEQKAPEETKREPVQITVGGDLPRRRAGDMPSPVRKGEGGKFEKNPAYGERKQADTDFNAGISDQKIIQNHSAAQFDEHRFDIAGEQKVKVSGKPMRATGYGPTNPRTGGTNKEQMGKIQKTAQRIEEARARNAALRTPHETPATKPSTTSSAPSGGPGKPPPSPSPDLAEAEKAGILHY